MPIVQRVALAILAVLTAGFVVVLVHLFGEVDRLRDDVLVPARADGLESATLGYVSPGRRAAMAAEARAATAREVRTRLAAHAAADPAQLARLGSKALPTVVVTATHLNLRDAPSIHAGRIGLFRKGTRLQFLRETSGPWLRVRLGEGSPPGWVYGVYVEGGHAWR
ncbi:MAG: SH3 domain-containing protein [Pseudomonadota bacterium]